MRDDIGSRRLLRKPFDSDGYGTAGESGIDALVAGTLGALEVSSAAEG